MGCFQHLLVPLDGTRDSTAALDRAVDIARDQHARLTLLAVVPYSRQFAAPGIAVYADFTQFNVAMLHAAVADVPPDIGVTTRLEYGKPAARIAHVAGQCFCDLVVIGCRSRGGWVRRILPRSLPEQLMEATGVSVLVVEAEDSAATDTQPLASVR
jgi:nucleotide-binding universal stress UspA family protein